MSVEDPEAIDPVAALFEVIGRFLVFADDSYRSNSSALEPLFNVVACWNYWVAGLSHGDQKRIRELIDMVRGEFEVEFLQHLRRELKTRYSTDSAATYFLCQLRQVPEFERWRNLEPARIGEVPWVNMLIVETSSGGKTSGLIVPVAAFLRKREAGQPGIRSSAELELGEAELARVREALFSLLRGTALARLILHGCFSGWTSLRPIWRWIRLTGWLVVMAALATLLTTRPLMSPSMAHDALCIVLPLVMVLAFSALRRCAQEVAWGWRTGKLLSRSQICVFSQAFRDGYGVVPVGASYCVSVAIAVLAAIIIENPPPRKSWLWGKFATELRVRLPRWAFTGGLSGTGKITEVHPESLPPKFQACLDHPCIAEFVMPKQDSNLSSTAKVEVARSSHLASLILSLAAVPAGTAKVASAVAGLCLAILLVASPELYAIFHPLPVPKPVLWKCEEFSSPSGARFFAFVAETDSPDAFLVRLVSPRGPEMWVPFHKEVHSPSHAKAEIPLPAGAVDVDSKAEPWIIEVARPESVLSWHLYDPVVLQEDFCGFRKAAEAERSRLFK